MLSLNNYLTQDVISNKSTTSITNKIMTKSKMNKSRKTYFDFSDVRKNAFLWLLVLPGIVYFIIFKYLPMIGVVIAFQDYSFTKGFFRSKWVGFENFKFFFTSRDCWQVTFNTIYLNILFIFTGLIFSILIALVLSEINGAIFKKVTQSIVILPHFLSWPLVSMFVFALFTYNVGVVNQQILKPLGIEPVNFYQTPGVWPTILVCMKIWKEAGFGSIVYLAAIAGIDQEIYEAAKIDGASRIQCIMKITLPQLRTTAVLLTILSIGGIFHGDFGMIYTLVGDNPFLYPTTDVIDTYVFRQLRQLNNMSMSTAVGLYQSVIGFILVNLSNFLAKKVEPDAAIF